MRETLPTELLLRLMNATPEQFAAVERILGIKAESGKRESGNEEEEPATDEEAEVGDQRSALTAEYRLGKQMGIWEVVFAGQRAVLDDGRAVELIAQLLLHPPESDWHASEWEARVDGNPLIDGMSIGRAEEAGRLAVLGSAVGGLIEEGTGKDFEGRMTLPKLKAELAELREASMDETLPELEREEAREQLLELLRAHQRGGRMKSDATRAADRVRKQVKTLIRELQGSSNGVHQAFGRHLDQHVWLPSMGGRNRAGAACRPGCFTYEPPEGVVWKS